MLRSRSTALVAALFACTFVAAGCGDDEDTTTPAGQNDGGAAQIDTAEVDEMVAEWSDIAKADLPKPPEEPFDPGSAKMMIIPCGQVGGCARNATAAEEACAEIGWDCTTFDGKLTPSVQAEGIQQAVQQKFDAILLISIDSNAVKSAVSAADKAGISMVCLLCASTPGFPDIANVTTSGLQDGDAMSWYIIQQTQGKANVVSLNDNAFEIVRNRVSSLEENLTERCSTCTIKKVDLATTDLAKPGPPVFTAALRADPDVNWAAAPYDAAVLNMTKATQQLNRDVPVSGWDGDPPVIEAIGSGEVAAATPGPYIYMAWASVDQAARLVNDAEPWDAADMPVRLATKDNWEQFKGGNWSPEGFDYEAVFKEIWSGGQS